MPHGHLDEGELLIVVEMCASGIEKCEAREQEHLRSGNVAAAEWDRQLRDRYERLQREVLAELKLRRRLIGDVEESSRDEKKTPDAGL